MMLGEIDAKALMVIGSLFPFLSTSSDKRVEMEHRLQGGQIPLISSHMDVHSASPSIGQHGGDGTDVRMD